MVDDSFDPRANDTREPSDARETSAQPGHVFARGLDLPHGDDRERVHVHQHDGDYDLRGSDVRALATVGAFRGRAV